MNNKLGFSILEFMIALCIGATICTLILIAYSETYKTYLTNIKLLTRNQDLYLAMHVIKNDVIKSGKFGDFNFHYQNDNLYQVSSTSSPLCSNSKFCELTPNGVGISSSLSDLDNISDVLVLTNDSDILKLQFGTNDVKLIFKEKNTSCQLGKSCLINKCNDEYYLNNLYFSDGGLDKLSSVYMLSSVSRTYLLKFSDTNNVRYDGNKFNLKLTLNGCPKQDQPFIKVLASAKLKDDIIIPHNAFDPDIQTISLSNFNTTYYFVAYGDDDKSGLYKVQLENTGTLSKPELVLDDVIKLKVNYILGFMKLDKNGNKIDEFMVCSTSNMLANDSMCSNGWDRVLAAKISLIAKHNNIVYQTTETISW
ncbi:MAG: hypothetical protein PHC75_00550 [Burkholderiales bacterium]|nr:hypothetical protein [Burkholderiales bacterium]